MNKKVDCILRLLDKNECYMDIAAWLIDQKLTDIFTVRSYSRQQERAEFIYNTLVMAEKTEKLILLDFTWNILPIEQIKIICITEREKKEFTYGF